MTKALMRKQLLEVFSWVYQNNKTGKHRSTRGIIGYALFYVVLFGYLAVIFGFCGVMLCQPLCEAGMGWLYWCLMGLLALLFGVFGSVFNTYGTLYRAKDNDLLLSMPVPVSRILLVRLSGVYAMGLMYELIVMLPALIVWFWKGSGSPAALLVPVLLSVQVLILSAALGWVVALISGRLRHKSILTVLISLVFLAVYYVLCGQASNALQLLLQQPETIGAGMKNALYLLYLMGRGATGELLPMLGAIALTAALLGLTWWLLARSFLRLATANRGAAKKRYEERAVKTASVDRALLRKELRRFTASSNYMLNSGLGIVLLPAAAIAFVWKAEELRPMLSLLPAELLPLLAAAMVCAVSTMNDMTAASVSLEGKTLWLSQALPVSGRQVLLAKLRLQVYLTLLPALFPVAALIWLMELSALQALLVLALVALFILCMSALGLVSNLKMPNLTWTNELVPIKQGAPAMIAILGGWLLVAALAGVVLLAKLLLPAFACAVLVLVLLLAADCVLLRWLTTKGARRFETL